MPITISQIQKEIKDGKKVTQVVQDAIQSLKNNAKFNIIASDNFKKALEKAKLIQSKLDKGEDCGRLAGIPYIVKDNILSADDSNSTAASNILKGFNSPYNATVIKKLEAEGAILIAKANMDSFGHGSSNENSDLGPVFNPHDPTRVPGGSSGGPAVSVALDIVPFALGTDTGGSIRLPASFCGVYGLKPSYGLVSRRGVVAMASSTDCVGPLANSPEDIALILDIISGKDSLDSTTVEKPILDYTTSTSKSKMKIGLIKEFMATGVDSEVKEAVIQTAEKYKKLGHIVEEISIPELDYALACYYILVPAEIASNLARYDGIRYGLSNKYASNLDDLYQKTRSEGFNKENKRRILIGNYVLSSGYYDAYYKKAQKIRTLIINAFKEAFKEFDVLIGPVAPNLPFKVGQNTKDALSMYLEDIMTVPSSLAGLSAISIPVTKSKKDNLPIGLQIIAPHLKDQLLLSVSKELI